MSNRITVGLDGSSGGLAAARTVIGQPAIQILDAASGAALVVVGRRIRRSTLGTHTGPITHAVMHHATSPVAVVAHD